MSQNLPKKKPQQRKTQPPSKENSTQMSEGMDKAMDFLEMFRPLAEFHQEVPSATDNDLRIYWDVRILRGANEPFISTCGSSSLPGILGDKLKPMSTHMIQKEVDDKIAAPLVGQLQSMVESGTFARLAERANTAAKLMSQQGGTGLIRPERDLDTAASEAGIKHDERQQN